MKTPRNFLIIVLCAAIVVGSALVLWLLGREQESYVVIGSHKTLVEVADTEAAQAQGLSGRHTLAPGHGMLFVFSPPRRGLVFWMEDMSFGLDIVWIADGHIVAIDRDVPAPAENEAPATRAAPTGLYIEYVLEVPAGNAQEWRPGDSVEIQY